MLDQSFFAFYSLVLRSSFARPSLALRSPYSVHLETQFFLAPVSPVEGTETGLTGGGKNTKYKMEV